MQADKEKSQLPKASWHLDTYEPLSDFECERPTLPCGDDVIYRTADVRHVVVRYKATGCFKGVKMPKPPLTRDASDTDISLYSLDCS